MAVNHYFKYRVPYELIYSKLNEYQKVDQLNLFIDLPSIARGLYSRTTQYLEINRYLETKEMPVLMIDELREFLNSLYNKLNKYNPKFIIFFDSGKAIQTKSVDSEYKSSRSTAYNNILEDEEREIHRAIRSYYYQKINEVFPRHGLCSVIYDKNYEMDLLPHYCISKGLANTNNPNTVNIIFSSDKDLLQTCEFPNTFQATSIYAKKEIQMNLWDKDLCIKYIYPKFLRGILTAKHIPLLLAIAGDKADDIPNCVAGMGIAKAITAVSNNAIPHDFTTSYLLPDNLEPYKSKILKNLSLTSFDLQIERIPDPDLINLSNKLSILDK